MRVSTRGDYACRALLSLALRDTDGAPTSVRDIAERTGLPQPYLEQILLALKGAGLVRSKRGVGGGYVLEGQLVHGASDGAGEIGHTTVNLSGRRCACGNYGCLEAYAAGPAIAARAREGLEAGASSSLPARVDGDLERITAAVVYEAVVEGDAFATEVLTDAARVLGVGVANIINLLNPEVVVIMGGVTRAGEHLLAPLRDEVRRRAFRGLVDACDVRTARLGEAVGVVGAAGLLEATLRQPPAGHGGRPA